MSSLPYVNNEAVVDIRAYISMLRCSGGEREQAVQLRNDIRVQLHLGHPFAESEHQFLIESVLNNLYLLFGSSDFLLVGFEFVGYITLGVDESLFSDPLGWHLFFVCVTHLKVIAENIIVSYFKALNTSPFYLALLYLEQVFLSVGLYSSQFVEFSIDSSCDDIRPPLC